MQTKTYRVKIKLAESAEKRVIEYIAEEKELVTESEMISVAIEKGLKDIKNDEIREMVRRQRNE